MRNVISHVSITTVDAFLLESMFREFPDPVHLPQVNQLDETDCVTSINLSASPWKSDSSRIIAKFATITLSILLR